MKDFLKTLWNGFTIICTSAISVSCFVTGIFALVKLPTYAGWQVLGVFILSTIAISEGILFMWILGSAVAIDDKNENGKEETK